MFDNTVPVKWLRNLFYIHLAILAASLLSWLPISDQWLMWLQRILIVGAALCLSQLSLVSGRYRKAAIFRIIHLAGVLINALLFSSTAIMLAAAICSLLATYQEYSAHSELIATKGPVLSRKWHSLFNWAIATAVLTSFGSMIVSIVSVFIGMDIAAVVTIVMVIVSLPQHIVDVFYLMYLNRMIHLLQKEE